MDTFMRFIALCLTVGLTTIAFSDPIPLLISHRGENTVAPENTMAAFRLSRERNVPGFECDLHLTADGHIVIIHNYDTQSTCPNQPNHTISNSTLAQLRELSAHHNKPAYQGEKIPTLDEVLTLATPGKLIYLEVKSQGVYVVPILKQYLDAAPHATPDTIRIISFDETIIAAVRQQLPDYTAVLLLWNEPGTNYYAYPPINAIQAAQNAIQAAQRCNAHGISISTYTPGLPSEYIQTVHDAGLSCHVWTVNSLDDIITYHERGMDSITSDYAGDRRKSMIDSLGYIYTVTFTSIEIGASGQVRLAFDYEGALDTSKVKVRQWFALGEEKGILLTSDSYNVTDLDDGKAEILLTSDAPKAFFRIEVEKD